MKSTVAGDDQIADIGIEYSHIYVDQQFNTEQIKSIDFLKKSEVSYKGKNISRIILIDDYSPNLSFDRFNLSDFYKQLALLDVPSQMLLFVNQN
jgi:hypothetical protein